MERLKKRKRLLMRINNDYFFVLVILRWIIFDFKLVLFKVCYFYKLFHSYEK